MSDDTTEVTGCADCPLREVYDGYGPQCHVAPRDADGELPEGPGGEVGEGSPDWCPLRKGPITIRLKAP